VGAVKAMEIALLPIASLVEAAPIVGASGIFNGKYPGFINPPIRSPIGMAYSLS